MQNFAEYLRSNCGQAMMLTFAGAAAVQGLIAIWAATARANWFLRALAVWGGVILVVPIRAYEPAALFAIASPLTVALISGLNWLENLRQPQSAFLPMRRSDWWTLAVIVAVAILGCEPVFQGHWWFDAAAFLAWCGVLVAIIATIYDCIATRGRVTWQRLLSLWRLATTSLGLATTSLRDQSAGNTPATLPTRPRIRFTLRDLFFLLLLVALLIAGIQAIDQRYTAQEWLAFGFCGALVAVIVSLAYGCVVSRWRLIFVPLLVVAVAVTARIAPGIVGPFFAERFMECLGLGIAFTWKPMQKLLALEIVYTELALLIVVVCSLVVLTQVATSPPLLRRLPAGVLTVLTVAGGLFLAWLYGQMLWLTPVPPPFAGGTTHYAEIAAIMRHSDPQTYWGSPIPPQAGNTPSALRVTGDRQALIEQLSVLVLSDNYVPFQVRDGVWKEQDVKNFRRGYEHFCAFAQVIDDEAIRASQRSDYQRAAELALINIRLGTMLRRGGMETHSETGKYCESYGYQRLTLIRDHLSPETTRSVIAALGRAAALPEDQASVRARGRAFSERAIGWTHSLRAIFRGLGGLDQPWDPDAEIATFNILLQTDLAIRLFQHDQGKLPDGLESLVPDYLPAVPLDPLAKTPQPLRYRVENGRFILYSVNSFGEDNGGEFSKRQYALYFSNHDIDLETWTRP
jgi:hypothetical protein